MAMGVDGGLLKPRELCQAVAEHFQQRAESPLLCNRGLGALAVTVEIVPLDVEIGEAALLALSR